MFAIPAGLHVGVLFMVQFIFSIALFGGVIPSLHRRGYHTVLLVIGGIVCMLVLHIVLGALARLVPARCRGCRSRASFQGFGWWPFIYRYQCSSCGQETRLEVSG
ncbi:MAG TPA: hypothetical protein VFU23_14110 [Gemmatimonadales bacterium]|nr:hypothetical protein [Gemmatimonadales bacterium]